MLDLIKYISCVCYSLRSIDRYSSSDGQPAATPRTKSSDIEEAPVTDSLVADDGGALTVTSLPDGDNQKTKHTLAPGTASPGHGKETVGAAGSGLVDPDNESFKNEAKNSKHSEAEMDRTEAADEVVDAANSAGVPPDVMLADAPAPPGIAGRTPDGENSYITELVNDNARTSGSDDSMVSGKGMAGLADDTRNLMKEGVSGASLTQADSLSPAAPHARENLGQDQDAFEGSAVEMVKICGMRVEEHAKGIVYEDQTASVMANTDAKLRLFGQDLTTDTEVLFTAYPAEAGEVCTAHLSKAFKVSILLVFHCLVTHDGDL